MKNRKLALRATAALLIAYAAPATAQNYVPPPSQFVTDPNGVDPKSNMLNFSETDATLGQFALVRSIPTHKTLGRQEFGQWIFNFTGYIYSSYDSSDDPDKYHRYGPTTLSAVLGNRSFSFWKEVYSSWEANNPAQSISVTGTTPALTVTITTESGEVLTYLQADEPCENANSPDTYCGRISSYEKPDGERWDFGYDTYASGMKRRVSKVTSNLGYVALFEYSQTTNDQPSKACLVNSAVTYTATLTTCPTGAITVQYGSGTITKPNGDQVLYTATSDSILMRRGSGSTTAEFYFARGTFGADSVYARGTSTSGTGGERWTYDATYMDCSAGTACAYPGQITQQIVTAPDSTQTKYEYRDVVIGGTVHMIDPLPNKVTNALSNYAAMDYGFGSNGYVRGDVRLKTLTLPEGNAEEFTYDGRLNTTSRTLIGKPGSGVSNVVASAVYPSSCSGTGLSQKNCNKPTSATDARGNTISYTFSDTHGELLSEVSPAVGGVSPAKKYVYALRKAWVSNGSGFVQPSTGVYLPTEERSCRTTALDLSTGACAGGTSDLVVVAYDYGPDTGAVGNNLLVRGKTVTADGITLRTCYGYDPQGNKIWETSPRAGLTVCS